MMEEDEILRGLRREWLYNITITPVVLLVLLPLGILFVILGTAAGLLERLGPYIPGYRRDYARRWRRMKQNKENANVTLLPERSAP
jgi:hypothetical protein